MLGIAFMQLVVAEGEALGLDPRRFAAFYDEALPKIYGYFLHRVGGSVQSAEDLTQETFLAAVAELKKGRRPDAPMAWLFGIARHKLIHHYRSRNAADEPRVAAEDALGEAPADESAAVARERAVSALAALPSVAAGRDRAASPRGAVGARGGGRVGAERRGGRVAARTRARHVPARVCGGGRMSGFDPLALLDAEFDAPVSPRAEFTVQLRKQVLHDLAARPPRGARQGGWRTWLLPTRRPGRLVLVLLMLIALLAGAAVAGYFDLPPWVSTSPRGIQILDDYKLSTVYVDRGTQGPVGQWAASPDGSELVGVRSEQTAAAPSFIAVEHIAHPLSGSAAHPRAGVAWAPSKGILVAEVGAHPDVWIPRNAPLAFTPGGDLLLALDGVLTAVHRDGTSERIVTVQQLMQAGLVPFRRLPFDPDQAPWLTPAASAADRIWLRVDSGPYQRVHTLLEVTDPNGDGRWGDRVVRRVRFPAAGRRLWANGVRVHGDFAASAFVGDPADGGSVLDAVTGPGDRLRLIRIADRNGDGDVSDRGEFEVILDHDSARGPYTLVAPRISGAGKDARHEIVLAGLTRADRLSLLSDSGDLSDIGRSFAGFFNGLATRADGGIYVSLATSADGRDLHSRLFRLTPKPAAAGASARQVREATPRFSAPPPSSRALIAATLENGVVAGPLTSASFWVPADGGRRRSAGVHVGTLCQSSDGREVAFGSDLVVPDEAFTYVAPAGGGASRKVTEDSAELQCGWSGRWLVLVRRVTPGATLFRIDARDGTRTLLARGVDRYSVAPDGLHVVVVRRRSTPAGPRETLELVDVATLARHQIAPAVPGRTYGVVMAVAPDRGFAWSQDGKRLAYISSSRPWLPWLPGQVRSASGYAARYAVWTQAVSGGSSRRMAEDVPSPTLALSPDGTLLLARSNDLRDEYGHRLLVFDAATGAVVATVTNRLNAFAFSEWEPSGHTLVYADPSRLWRLPIGKSRQLLAHAPAGDWPDAPTIGDLARRPLHRFPRRLAHRLRPAHRTAEDARALRPACSDIRRGGDVVAALARLRACLSEHRSHSTTALSSSPMRGWRRR